MTTWKKLTGFGVGHVPIEVYRSEKSGMQAMFAQVPTPQFALSLFAECASSDFLCAPPLTLHSAD